MEKKETAAQVIALADYETYCRWMRSVSEGRPTIADFEALSVSERQSIQDCISRWEGETVEISLYRLGGNWIWVDDTGREKNMGPYMQNKVMIRSHIRSYLSSQNPNDSRRVKFCWG